MSEKVSVLWISIQGSSQETNTHTCWSKTSNPVALKQSCQAHRCGQVGLVCQDWHQVFSKPTELDQDNSIRRFLIRIWTTFFNDPKNDLF